MELGSGALSSAHVMGKEGLTTKSGIGCQCVESLAEFHLFVYVLGGPMTIGHI